MTSASVMNPILVAVGCALIAGGFIFLSSGWLGVFALAAVFIFAGILWLRSMLHFVTICAGAMIFGAYVASIMGRF